MTSRGPAAYGPVPMTSPSSERRPVEAPPPSGGATIVLLGSILLLALLLRLVDVGLPSFRHDEIASARMVAQPGVARVIEVVARDVHPPAHFLLLHALARVGLDDEFGFRLPSVLFGSLGVWLTFLLGTRLFGRRQGILAAALLAVSAPAVFFSQEARPYAMLMAAALAATWFWFDLMDLPTETPRPGLASRAGLVLASLLCAYTHYFGLLVIALQGCALGIRHLKRPRKLLGVAIPYLLILAGLLPWLGTMRTQHDRPSFYLPRPDLGTIRAWVAWNANDSEGVAAVLLLLGAVAAGHTLLVARRRNVGVSLLDPTLLVAGWFVGPFAVAFLASCLSLPVLTHRYTIVSLPAAFLLVAQAVEHLPVGSRPRVWIGSGLVLLFAGHLVFGVGHGIRPERTQYREAVAHVVAEERAWGRELVVTCGGAGIYDYYFRRLGSEVRGGARACREDDLPAVETAVRASGAERFWLLRGNEQPTPELMSGLAQRFRILEQAVFYGADAWRFEEGRAPVRDLAGRWRTLWGPPPGTRIREEGGILHVHVDSPPLVRRPFLVCQSGPVPLRGPRSVRGRWRLDPGADEASGIGLMARVSGAGAATVFRGLKVRSPGARWGPVRATLTPEEGETAAELCVRIAIRAGDLRLDGLRWRFPGRSAEAEGVSGT